MKVKNYESVQERKIITALIVHDHILAKVYEKIGGEKKPFNHKWLDLIARWCFNHFEKYGKAPKHAIEAIFSEYAETSKDEETISILDKFLSQLSEDYKALAEEMNEDYVIDLASNHFKKVKLLRTAKEVESLIEAGDLEEAEIKQAAYQAVDFSSDAKEDPFSKEAIKDTFRKVQQSETLVHFPNALGEFLSPHFKRSGFIAFAGPEKRGKSYWMLETVWQALRQKRKVLYYVFGDMPKHEVYQRLYCRALRRPWKETELRIPKKMKVSNDGKSVEIKFKTETRKGLEPLDVWKARKKLLQQTASRQVNLKVQTSGGNTISASGIEREVKDLSLKEGWEPDVVVIDYADLLEPEIQTRGQDVRHQINLTWMILRRIALDSHCLVVTGTQAAATAYDDKWVIRKGDFSEDKRKNAHVTGMVGINQSENEKREGIYRLNWPVLRGGHWSENHVVWTAGNLAIASPALISTIGR